MSYAAHDERIRTALKEADRILMEGECLGAARADLVFPWLCLLLTEEGKKLTVPAEDLEEYRLLAEDPEAGEGVRFFARRCMGRARNLEDLGLITEEDPRSRKGNRQVLVLMDRNRLPEWAEENIPFTGLEIGEDGEAEILILGQKKGFSLPTAQIGSRIAGWTGKTLRTIRTSGIDWLLGNDF